MLTTTQPTTVIQDIGEKHRITWVSDQPILPMHGKEDDKLEVDGFSMAGGLFKDITCYQLQNNQFCRISVYDFCARHR